MDTIPHTWMQLAKQQHQPVANFFVMSILPSIQTGEKKMSKNQPFVTKKIVQNFISMKNCQKKELKQTNNSPVSSDQWSIL